MPVRGTLHVAPALMVGFFCFGAAAADAISSYSYGEFTDGYALIWHDAEMLADPDASPQTLASLTRGSLVEITGPPSDSLLWNGIGLSWYPVITPAGTQGFVAGTDIALAWARLDPDPTILLAITARNDSLFPEFAGAVLAVTERGEVADSIPIWLPPLMYEPAEYDPWSYCTDLTEADGTGLDGVVSAVILAMWVEGCGYVNTEQIFVWDGKTLIEGPTACSMVEAGLFHSTGSLVLPSDPGGEENRITVLIVNEEWVEADNSYRETERIATAYHWDGSSFTEE